MPHTDTPSTSTHAMRLLRWGAACALMVTLTGCSSFSLSKLWPWGNKAEPEVSAQTPATPAEPEKPAAPEPTTFPETPPSPLPAQVASPSTQSVALAPTPPVVSPAPMGGEATSKKASPAKASPAHDAGSLVRGYYVNVGLFAVASNGTNAFRKLEAAGLPVFTDVVQSRTKGPLTRVRVGPYPSPAEADQAAKDIKAQGLDALVFEFAGHPAAKGSKKAKPAAAKPKAQTSQEPAGGKETKSMGSAGSAKAEAAKPAEKKQ
ncbi:SPOR domain-containing protein [Curvibacter sp. CHRR-16]|uniref:SPOR domain-containing protein n=1 Tax=Curvibacter sp. CHRR-16 TaxID=2835872 RepID=UPI001BD9B931|nr:SPOR domain-containing protein [Curvibacter sp. CHRR-16]MBT0569790.1 SPOR domain-containing protein [Curvibacter sp. CHRR-16]